MIVHDGWHQDVDHLGQIVLQQVDDFLQGLQSVEVDLAVGLLQSGPEGIKHLRERNASEEKKKNPKSTERNTESASTHREYTVDDHVGVVLTVSH